MNESDAFPGSGRRNHCIGSVAGNASVVMADGCDRYLTALHSIQAPQVLRSMQTCSEANLIPAKTDYYCGHSESGRASVIAYWPMEMSNPDARQGNMCALHASGGRKGRDSCVVWVDFITPWFGRSMEIPRCATSLFVYEVELSRKWPVAPVSATRREIIGGEEASL